MTLQNEIIEKILSEVDPDIRDILLKTETRQNVVYKGYELLDNPANTILNWQLMRYNKPIVEMKVIKINGNKRFNN